jgi:hypothetical protein
MADNSEGPWTDSTQDRAWRTAGTTEEGEFLDQLNNYKRLHKEYAP